MRKVRFMSALLSGAMTVGMFPLALTADVSPIRLNSENIPDEALRAYIAERFDRNSDGILNAQEIDDVRQIKAEDLHISDLTGLDLFPRLHTLWVDDNDLTTLDLSGITSLREVTARNNNITSVDLSGMTGLQKIDLDHNHLSSIDLSGLDNLTSLGLGDNDLSSFDARGLGLQALDLRSCEYLTDLKVGSDALTSLDIQNCSNITSLDVSACPNITHMYLHGTGIMEIDFSNNLALMQDVASCDCELETGWEEYDYLEYTELLEQGQYSSMRLIHFTINPDVYITWPSGADITIPTPTIDPDNPVTEPVPPRVEIPDEPGVSGFVERLYTVALGRSSDPAGKQNWIDAITSGANTGADAARGFLLSPEFVNSEMTTTEFVYVLYRTFFGREPDRAGRISWINAINDGASREEVINGFINSTEWANLCLSYGINSGGSAAPNIEVEPNSATIEFATRLYTTCLNRNADENGMMAWARQLANQRDTGTGSARGFFFSEEFTRQNVSNDEFVNRLYRTFMGREADEAGFTAWVAQLDNGVSREEVFNGFAESPEFARICASYGIIKGS